MVIMLFDTLATLTAGAILAYVFGFPVHKGVLIGMAVCLLRLTLPRWGGGA